MAPSLRVAAEIRLCVVVGLDLGATKAFGLRLVWSNFREAGSPARDLGALGLNAARWYMSIHPGSSAKGY